MEASQHDNTVVSHPVVSMCGPFPHRPYHYLCWLKQCSTQLFGAGLPWRSTIVAQMELLLVNYVALFYILWSYFACKRWYCSLRARGGRRSLKRLQRCAPQILVRAARIERQCQLILEKCVQQRHWLQYSFCYYYGGHANSVPAWLMSAGTLYALWNDLHVSSIGECYALSIITFSGMAALWCHGPWMGVVLGVAMPAFMRCQVCPPERTAEGCMEFQRQHGCHACDRRGCWHANPLCLFYDRSREAHEDALLGDTVPHMRETRITCTADGTQMEGRLQVDWWRLYNDVRFVLNEAQHFTMCKASGHESNCLIDTLRQLLLLDCDIGAVREYVQAQHANLAHGE